MPTLKHDVFISYNSEDRPWAKKLQASLEERQQKVFWDEKLRSGEEWATQLGTALQESKHLVALWSTRARQPEGWVVREMNYFDLLCRPQTAEGPRHLIVVLLDVDQPPKWISKLHSLSDLQGSGLQVDEPQSISTRTWQAFSERLYGDLTHNLDALTVSTVVVASTRGFWLDFDFDSEALAPALGETLKRLGLWDNSGEPYATFVKRYGDGREEWRPFGPDEMQVKELLVEVENQVNQSLTGAGQPPIQLKLVNHLFWDGPPAERDKVARQLASGPSLVLIDPLSLHDPRVSTRLQWLRSCLSNHRSAVVLLSPHGSRPRSEAIRDQIQGIALDIYQHFFDPAVPQQHAYAPSAAHVGDLFEIKRCLLLALGQSVPTGRAAPSNAFLSNAL